MNVPRLSKIEPHSFITTNAFFITADGSLIVKVHRPKRRTFRLLQYRMLALTGWPIPFEFRRERARCWHERMVYRQWQELGYAVPRVHEKPPFALPAPADLCLVLDYIKGRDLWTELSDERVAAGRKLDLIEMLFAETHARHADVSTTGNRWLIKYDANLRNVMLCENELMHIDFESGRIAESLVRGTAREVARYAVAAINTIGRDSAPAVVDRLRRGYRHLATIERIVDQYTKGTRTVAGKINRTDLAALLAVA
jgi:hypothetical protein